MKGAIKRLSIFYTIFFVAMLIDTTDTPQIFIEHPELCIIGIAISYILYSMFDDMGEKNGRT